MPFTMKESLEKRLQRTLREAIELADIGDDLVPARTVAERVFDTETELMTEVARPWVLERLTWLISRLRRTLADQDNPLQLCLPDPIFKGLPKTIFLRNGERPSLLGATLTQTEDHLRLLRKRFKTDWRVKQFEAVVDLHRKWASKFRGISLRDAFRREVQEREADAAPIARRSCTARITST